MIFPVCCGNWKTVYNRHRRWSGDGTWTVVLDGLRADCDSDIEAAAEWVLSTDGTVIRAHHHSAGARHEPPKDIPVVVLAPTVLEVSLRPGKDQGARSNYKKSATEPTDDAEDIGVAGAQRPRRTVAPDREGLGHSRGGVTTKI